MRELIEDGFEVVGDATASAILPGLDGNQAAQTNFGMRNILRRALKSIEQGDYNIQSGLIYNDLFASCEKAGDHIINVTEALAGKI